MSPPAPNPLLGVLLHWIGGLAAASFYLPLKGVRRWSWETSWLVNGLFSWIIAPPIFASLLVPDTFGIIARTPGSTLFWTFFFGLLWGVGGLTFGLTVRYLGVALGYAVALGCCAAFGTLIPPIFNGQFGAIVASTGGMITLVGVLVCLAGIAVSGMAGKSKESEMSLEQKQATVKEFNFPLGITIAILCGIMSACMAFAFAAAAPIGDAAGQKLAATGGLQVWKSLPSLVVILWGGFLTNFIWCLILHAKNRSGHEYLAPTVAVTDGPTLTTDAHGVAQPAASAATAVATAPPPAATRTVSVPLALNYALAAAAGLIWYFQFFFYSMGETKMGAYSFSSWTLHMASIIIFSTLWGVALKEWKGSSTRTHALIAAGLAILMASTLVIGYGNYVSANAAKTPAAESAH